MEVSGQLHAPATLSPTYESLVPIGQELGWLQSRSDGSGEEKDIPSLPVPGIEPQSSTH